MNYELLLIFIGLSFVNVILQTVKSLLTISGTKFVSAIANALAYGLYTIVIIYTNCDLDLWSKVVITMVTNFIGVYVSKWLVDKFTKDKLWRVDMAIRNRDIANVISDLKETNIPFGYYEMGKWVMFNCYCHTQNDSAICKSICKEYKGKISAYESKPL